MRPVSAADSKIKRFESRSLRMTDTRVIELDFGSGWVEPIGQGLHYSAMTKKKAGVVLILENSKDRQKTLDSAESYHSTF